VAAYHWDAAGQPQFTFEMLYESFRNQVRASSSAPVQVNGGSIGMMRCSRQMMTTVGQSALLLFRAS
jgi:origin recognition complex subunit 4